MSVAYTLTGVRGNDDDEEHRTGMSREGTSINAKAQHFNVHRISISRLQAHFNPSGTVWDLQWGIKCYNFCARFLYSSPAPKKSFRLCCIDIKKFPWYEAYLNRLCGPRPAVRTLPETSSQASEIAMGKAAHLVAFAEMEKSHVRRNANSACKVTIVYRCQG